MNRFILIGLVLFAGSGVKAQSETEISYMSLEEAEVYALEHNQTGLNAGLEVLSAEAFIKENLAEALPQISGVVDISNNFALPPSFLPAEIVGGPPGETVVVQFGTKYSGGASATLNQMVFDGRFFLGMEAARTFGARKAKEHIKTNIDIVEAVAKSYYGVLVNDLTIELIEKNYERLDTLLMETQIMYDNGFAEKIDVSRIRVQFNNIKVELTNAKRLRKVNMALLKFHMGMPIDQQLELSDVLSAEIFEQKADATNFEPVNRIEYSILQSNQQIAELDLKRTKVGYAPNMDIYAKIGASAGTGEAANIFNITNEWFSYGFVGINLQIPIFDGLRKHRAAQQKQIKIDQINNSFGQLANSIDLEVQETSVRLENSLEFMYVQRENMDLSEEVYNVTKIKYQQGVGSNIEVITADADYKQAQLNFFRALYDALIAKVNHDKALGQLL